MGDRLIRLYGMFENGAAKLQSPLLLLVRLYWGWQFAQTGWGKLQHLSHVASFFTQLGMPWPYETAIFVALVEFGGGILLAFGAASRPVALALVIDMTVAYIASDTAALTSFFSDPGKFYGADPFTFLAASLIILIFGPGLFSVDTLLRRKFLRYIRNSREGSVGICPDERLTVTRQLEK